MLKTAPPVTCSGKHCEKLLYFDSYKANLCDDCMSRVRRHGSRSNANIVPRKAEFAAVTESCVSSLPTRRKKGLPLPVESMHEPSLYQQSSSRRLHIQNSQDASFPSIRLNHPKLTESHLNRSQRMTLPIPHQPSQAYRLPSSIMALGLQELPAVHFNSRGEHVPVTNLASSNRSVPVEMTPDEYTKTICATGVIAPINAQPFPSIQHDITPSQSVSRDEEDIDMDDIELSYPYLELPEAAVDAGEHLNSNISQSNASKTHIADSSQGHDSSLPKKRLKVSHEEMVDLTSTALPNLRFPPAAEELPNINIKRNKYEDNHASFRTLKLCSMAGCTGIVLADSLSSRCLECVRHDWKAKKSRALSTAAHDQNVSSESAINHPLTKPVKKGVTWADELANNTTAGDQDSKASKRPGKLRISLSVKKSKSNPLASQSSADSGLRQTKLSIICTSNDDSKTQSLPKIRLSRISIPSARASESHRDSVWDSDLTELSDSTTAGENYASLSNLESRAEATNRPSNPQSSVLKIRIPPRPNGVHIRQCAAHRCYQLLGPEYRWKSCIMCRARSRDCQRKRQNLHGKHIRLGQEFQAHRLGTPLSGDIYEELLEGQDAVLLVPGARLCSIRNCTFIIPPVEEYRWTMCSLCRICRKERSRQDKYNFSTDTPGPISVGGETKERTPRLIILKDIKHLPLRSGPCPSNRCHSIDCGMLKSKSPKCKQCTARHNWLLDRSGNNIQYPPNHRRSERPRRPAPYPQYTCFSAFLLEFKKHLAGFLQAQSLFFLFRCIKDADAMFAFDGEFSVVAPNFDLLSRQDAIDAQAQKYMREIEHIGRIKFKPKRLISILEGGGMAVRFVCHYTVPILAVTVRDDESQINTKTKSMQCELEVANLPDHSHPFIPGERVVVRFRLLG